jgi:hypothetical protein
MGGRSQVNRVVKLRRYKYGRKKPGDGSELWQRHTHPPAALIPLTSSRDVLLFP